MKVLLVIDHLGLGGAQRQMVELACGLAARAHTVELFNYFPEHDFFLQRVRAQGIRVHGYRKGRGFSLGVIRALAQILRRGRFDIVLSFLNNPNLYAELASIASGAKLVVSERVSHDDDRFVFAPRPRRYLHALADHVVANSETHAAWLRSKAWLRDKVSCIYNGLDLQALAPGTAAPPRRGELRLLAVGRVCLQKNPLMLIAGLRRFAAEHDWVPEVSWAGRCDASASGREYAAAVNWSLAAQPEIAARWHWLGEEADMPALLRRHDALIHASLYEGLPNAVCEALSAGLPVLASNVCDHALLVAEGERGFLFDPRDPESIAASLAKAAALDEEAWRALSGNARSYAESHLGVAHMVNAYERLFMDLTSEGAARAQRAQESR
jgi:glycosyltransferase involved in cell wall biosynthesis